MQLASRAGAGRPTPYQDIRKLLDDRQVDACNHWHALATVGLPGR